MDRWRWLKWAGTPRIAAPIVVGPRQGAGIGGKRREISAKRVLGEVVGRVLRGGGEEAGDSAKGQCGTLPIRGLCTRKPGPKGAQRAPLYNSLQNDAGILIEVDAARLELLRGAVSAAVDVVHILAGDAKEALALLADSDVQGEGDLWPLDGAVDAEGA